MEFLGKVVGWVVDKVKKVWRWFCSWIGTKTFRWITIVVMVGAIIWAAAGTATVVLAGVTIPTGAVVFTIALVFFIWSLVCKWI